jgi:hypothetical protein
MTQPEVLQAYSDAYADAYSDAYADAEAELRRLHEVNQELLAAAKRVVAWYEAEDDHSKADFYTRLVMCRESESALRAAIAKAEGEQK